ncbi:unnamed protein product [Cuscuta campestris]|uniref:C2H2-type domain-containing protein n=1 Tax=Cuscuta campestris TaxID=132261 RepID=A0A484MSE3_9ASTE|nr:unnamed protein product [Cuscuta campestris]
MWTRGKPNTILIESCSVNQLRILSCQLGSSQHYHIQTKQRASSDGVSCLSSDSSQRKARSIVGIFWDLDNKPPKTLPPFEAASKIRKAAEQFGFVKYMVAYANQRALSYVPPLVRQKRNDRKVSIDLEYTCRVCGRRFYTNEKLVNHFKQIHERENTKRVNQIESATGSRRVKLVAKYAAKMHKYKNACRDILTPKVGYGLVDELRKAGFWVKAVSNKPDAADVALRDHLVDMMAKRMVECVFLISDDSDFVEVLKEAKSRCLKTVVVGDVMDGALKRTADASFSWAEVVMEKAKKEAVTVVGRWKDRDVLKKLEWTYDPERDKKYYTLSDFGSEDDSDVDLFVSEENDDDDDDHFLHKEDNGAWWELGSETKCDGSIG